MERMKGIDAAREVKANNVKAVFQNTHHYTSVLHLFNGLLSLYDEKTMSIVAVSKTSFSQPIRLLSFSKRYGNFCVYFDRAAKYSSKNSSSPFITVFTFKEFGRLESYSHIASMEETIGRVPSVHSMATLDRNCHQQSQEILILFEQQNYRVLSLEGKSLAVDSIAPQGRQLTISKSYHINEDRFLFVQENAVIAAKFSDLSFSLQEQVRFDSVIQSTYMDWAVHKKYVGIVTRDMLLHIASIGAKCTVCYTLAIPSFFITQLCFFYPGVNSSPTNKFKDRVYAVLQGIPVAHGSERSNDKQSLSTENFMGGSVFIPSNVYIFQFKQCCLGGSLTPFKLKQLGQFYLETGLVKQLLFNEHHLNCLRAVTESGQLVSYSLCFLFDGVQVDAEWIYLAFRFEHCSGAQSFEFEPREDEFEQQPYRRDRKIAEEELDDWSYSCFGPTELANLRQRRGCYLSNI